MSRKGAGRAWAASAFVAALLASLGGASSARAVAGDVDGAFGIEGSFRSIGAVSFNYDDALFPNDADAFFQAPLRVIVAGRPTGHWSYTVHGIESVTATTYVSPVSGTGALPNFGLAAGTARYRALDLDWEQVSDPQTQLTLSLDRANVARESGRVSVRIGRQAISLGHAFLWSPMDVFLPFDPRQFDQEYKPGVDAGRVTWAFGAFSGFDVIGVAGRKTDYLGQPVDAEHARAGADWYGSAVLGRAYTNVLGFDLSLQGGKIYGAYQIAGGFAGEVRGIDLRGEVAVNLAQSGSLPGLPAPFAVPGTQALIEDQLFVTLAAGYYFAFGVTVQAQYYYNGAGEPDDLLVAFARVGAQESLAASHNLVGLSAMWQATPLINLGGLLVVSGDDGSLQIQPIVRYSVSDEAEFLVGAAINIGERPDTFIPQSEFGTSPTSLFFEFKFYF